MEELPDVVERPAAVLVLERADEHVAGGQEQEQERVDEERQRAEPRERKAPPAGREPGRSASDAA